MIARYGILCRPWRPLASTLARGAIRARLGSTDVTAAEDESNGDTAQPDPQARLNVRRILRKVPAASGSDGFLPEQVRRMMRRIPHPLIVILAQDTRDPLHSGLPSGLLVSSFNTITLAPVPYVSFNLKVPSSTYKEIQKSGGFIASAISNPQIARDFLLDKESAEYRTALRENVVSYRSILKTGRGGIWWMKCSFMEKKSVEVGDHVVVIGKVINAKFYKGSQNQALIYSEGKYKIAGEGVDAIASTQRQEDEEFEKALEKRNLLSEARSGK
ncbi:MAG: hypothetical protein Q9177_001787 [Variospora cf. flavescens]